ncbi:hypothetical protein BHM03_00060869, partial [Ensete ventricosum]
RDDANHRPAHSPIDADVGIPTAKRLSVGTTIKSDVISSDSTDSVREQLRQVNQRLDEVRREFVKSKEEVSESSKGRSSFSSKYRTSWSRLVFNCRRWSIMTTAQIRWNTLRPSRPNDPI